MGHLNINRCGPIWSLCLALATSNKVCKASISAQQLKWDKSLEDDNFNALQMVNRLKNSHDGWKFVAYKSNVKVEKRFLPAGTFVNERDASKGAKHACVKSSGVINASPDDIFDLFVDNSRVSEYNDHCVEVRDVRFYPRTTDNTRLPSDTQQWSKVAWACSPNYGPFKPRDFCSVVHFIKYSNGTSIILNRPAYDINCAPTGKFVRATILLAANILEPFGDGKTRITQIAHVNPGGGADTPAVAWVINKLCAVGPPTFIKRLETAARTRRVSPKTPGHLIFNIKIPFIENNRDWMKIKERQIEKIRSIIPTKLFAKRFSF